MVKHKPEIIAPRHVRKQVEVGSKLMHRFLLSFTGISHTGETVTQKANVEALTMKGAIDAVAFHVDECKHYEITVDQLS